MSSRGLIVTPQFTVDAGGGIRFKELSAASTERSVKRNLLYWDAIDLPRNPIIDMVPDAAMQLLIDQGIVIRSVPEKRFLGSAGEVWLRSHVEVLRQHEKSEPGSWSMAQQGSTFWLPDDELVTSRMIETTLYDALPVPQDDTPIEDVLDFKQRRRDELMALRAELDALYLSVIKEADIPRAQSAALERLRTQLADLDKVATEAWGRNLLSANSVFIAVAGGAALGHKVAAEFSLPLEFGGAVGGLSGLLKFALKPEARLAKASPLTYAQRVNKELAQPNGS